MDVEIVHRYPPNIDAIREVFPLSGQEIFAWDGTIFNPAGGRVPDWLVEHEKVHFAQQAGDPESWWGRYLVDAEWRLTQELEAHIVEYRVFCKSTRDRNKRFFFLADIGKRLASPMYGSLITIGKAMGSIKRGAR